jgi:hypothetical protein
VLNKPILFLLYMVTASLQSGRTLLLDESTTTRTAGDLDFTAIGGKRQGREGPQWLRVKPGSKHPVWKTQLQAQKVDHAI